MNNTISAIIVVKDNPPYLTETLQSINNIVQEIIIADIGIDRILLTKLQKYKKIKIIPIKDPVPYVELIREKLKQQASGDFVLFLDPDEIFPQTLIDLIINRYQHYDYIKIPRKNIIFGKWIRHSRWWPDYQIRLFKKDAVIWPRELHKQPQAKGTELLIEPKEEFALIHHNYGSIDEFMEKTIRYAKSEAKNYIETNQALTLRITLQTSLSEFFSRYFAGEGFKDGMHGLMLSLFQMFYPFIVFAYYWEMKKFKQESDDLIQNDIRDYFRKGLLSVNHWQNVRNLVSPAKKFSNKILDRLLK